MTVQPWMTRRRGESVKKWHARLNRTCFACGELCPTTQACDQHEQTCPKATHRPEKRRR
jgi:hypothetical protein